MRAVFLNTTAMLFNQFKSSLRQSLKKHTDSELLSLERQFRRDSEWDAAQVCSEILLHRRNRPILAGDEYERSSEVGVADEDFYK
jgi:hypothetical protein